MRKDRFKRLVARHADFNDYLSIVVAKGKSSEYFANMLNILQVSIVLWTYLFVSTYTAKILDM